MFRWVRTLWKQLPVGLQERLFTALKPTGIPYVISFMARYAERQQLANFAGNLIPVGERYLNSTAETQSMLSRRFDAIMDSLVMRNGVRKTTYATRYNDVLARVLSDVRCALKRDTIRVLDIPCSTGIASLQTYTRLSERYRIGAYVLGDLYLKIYYDSVRGCIFDEDAHLLQVRGNERFFSIYQAHASGDVYAPVAKGVLLPFRLFAQYLRRAYPYKETDDNIPIRLIHPEVAERVADGTFDVRKLNVFDGIQENYDLIMSFNLLQRNYFSEVEIERGIANLKDALNEGGILIIGNTDAFAIHRKVEGRLVAVIREGLL
jgi:SAM-dependent methyltransferase